MSNFAGGRGGWWPQAVRQHRVGDSFVAHALDDPTNQILGYRAAVMHFKSRGCACERSVQAKIKN